MDAAINSHESLAHSVEPRLLQYAIKNLNDAIMITAADQLEEPGPTILYVNRAFEIMTGYSASHTIGRSPRFLQGSRTNRKTLDRVKQALRAGDAVRVELLNYRRDGSEFWVEMQIMPIRDDAGEITHFIAVQRDVTERKHCEEELEHHRRCLDDAQHLTHLGCWEWDVKSDVAYWSDEMYRLCGLEPQSKIFGRFSFLKIIHPEDQERVHSLVDDVLRLRIPAETGFRVVRPDGEVRHVHGRADAVCDEKGRVIRLFGTLQDVTSKLEADAARVRAERLEAANRELEAFSSSVAHDLRGPLRRILAYAQILGEEANKNALPEEARTCLNGIEQCTRHMRQLIEDLLGLAQVAQQPLDYQQFDFSKLCRELLRDLAEADPARQVTTVVQQGMIISADYRLTRVLMQNLLSNAWKFTGPRSDARIEISRQDRDARPIYCVRDNGVGFNPRFAHHLFRPFERLHAAEQFEGTGIGLATVHRIIARHNGDVWAESQPDQGAAFYFTLGPPEKASANGRGENGASVPNQER